MSRLRLLAFALAAAAALPATAQHRPAALPNQHGVDANRAAESMIRNDAAADAQRRNRVERTTDEADPAFVPDRVGRVQIEEVQIREDGSTEPLNTGDDEQR